MENRKVSILMSAYNCEEYIEEAMHGIMEQTYRDWECIVIDDCSTDRTKEILEKLAEKDSRIRVFSNEKNMKLPGSLNRALEKAEGKYVMRMDADDICSRERVEKQVEFMESHPELTLSSCRLFYLKDGDIFPAHLQRRADADAVSALFLFFDPIAHGGVIVRREVLQKLKYDPAFTYTEDLDLWIRMRNENYQMAIQEDYLIQYRLHGNQVTTTKSEIQREQYRKIIPRYYERYLFPLDEDELRLLCEEIYYRDRLNLKGFLRFALKIRKANRKRHSFSKEAVCYALFEVMMACREEFHLRTITFLALLASLPPVFVIREIVRRKRAAARAYEFCRQAAVSFGLEESGMGADKVMHYRVKKTV